MEFWAQMGISKEKVASAAATYWLEYAPPRQDDDSLNELFDCSLRDVTLQEPLHDNAMRILEHFVAHPSGVIVAGHRRGSKSQTLAYLEGLCRTIQRQNNVNRLFVMKISLKNSSTPENWQQLYGLLYEDILRGLLPICRSFLKAELAKVLGVPVASSSSASCVPDFPDDLYYQKFDPPNKVSVADHVLEVLKLHDIVEREHRLSTERLVLLYQALCALLRHREQTLCYSLFLVDEAGEAFNPEERNVPSDITNMFQQFLTPLKRLLDDQVRGSLRFCVALSGSRSIRSDHPYYEKRYCRLNSFTASQCNALWELWKLHATTKNKSEIITMVEAERWLGDLSSSPEQQKLGDVLQSLTDGIPGHLIELFRDALGIAPSPQPSLALIVEMQYKALCAGLLKTYKGGDEKTAVALVINALAHVDRSGPVWSVFAAHGLSPSPFDPPSAPVLRVLLGLIRQDTLLAFCFSAYGKLLTTLARLHPSLLTTSSSSLASTVFEERVRFQLHCGLGVRASKISKKKKKKIERFHQHPKKQKREEDGIAKPPPLWAEDEKVETTMFNSAQMSEVLSFDGTHLHRQSRQQFSFVPQGNCAKTTPKPTSCFLFVPESQTLPSINTMSIAQIAWKEGKEEEEEEEAGVVVNHVDVFHLSVSLGWASHFATFDEREGTWSKFGHLPLLDMNHISTTTTISLRRSARAQALLSAFRTQLEDFPQFQRAELRHHYAVVVAPTDDAKDLLSLVREFDQEDFFYVFRF